MFVEILQSSILLIAILKVVFGNWEYSLWQYKHSFSKTIDKETNSLNSLFKLNFSGNLLGDLTIISSRWRLQWKGTSLEREIVAYAYMQLDNFFFANVVCTFYFANGFLSYTNSIAKKSMTWNKEAFMYALHKAKRN